MDATKPQVETLLLGVLKQGGGVTEKAQLSDRERFFCWTCEGGRAEREGGFA